MKRVYIKYHPNNNLPTHEDLLPNQRYKEVKALESAVCDTNKLNQNFIPLQKDIIHWHFILGHIGFQHVKWLILTGRLKAQGNSKSVASCESTKFNACNFVKGHQ